MIRKYKIPNIMFVIVIGVLLVVAGGCKLTKVAPPDGSTPPGSSYDAQALWASSGHADDTAEAFRHWDEDDPPVVPTFCAKCHANDGFLDFLDNWTVDNAANPGVISCDVCHAAGGGVRGLDFVTFPSGATIGGLGPEAICMQCHQGRSSRPSVDSYLLSKGGGPNDAVNPGLSFRNIHYFAAAATLYGSLAQGGYQYPGRTYDGKFGHVGDADSCTECHDPHSLKVKTEFCGHCHHGLSASAGISAASSGGLYDIRYTGSLVDYDGDGNISEGIYYEIDTFKNLLVNVLWSYSADVCGTPVVYEAHTYPYFFKDNNANGVADPGEANYGNQFRLWTPRLMKAAYNYQVAMKDPGGFAHGGKYIIQLLYDSIMDLRGASPNPITIPALNRSDEGHFDGSTEAWRHWDEDGMVSGSCAKCHSDSGLPYYLEHGENEAAPVSNGLLCSTCHDSANWPGLRENREVTFPSGAVLSMPDASTLCMECHQGRASKYSVDAKIAGGSGNYTFTNIHYFPVAAVLFGTEAKGGYEYSGKTYVGRKLFLNHGDQFDTCIECHMGTKGAPSGISHNVHKPNPVDCVICHGRDDSQPYPGRDPAKFKFSGIRPGSTPDYDGDGNVTESIKAEIQGLEATLYYRLQAHARAVGKPLIYDSHAYPYFFNDKNANGLSDPGEAIYPNRYRFNANLLKAAYNYQVSRKEPHGYIHNSMYVAQLLVDSIVDLGGSAAPYTWR